MPDFFAPRGIQLKLFSPTEEVIGILSDTDASGSILDAKVRVLKIGGIDAFSFHISKDVDIPITRNTIAYVYVRGTLWFKGYIKEIPQPDQSDPVLIVEGEGFYKRLEKKIINVDYDTETLGFIIDDVASTYLGAEVGVFYDPGKLDFPVIADIVTEFIDKNLLDVFTTLLSICNYDYITTKYRFYVDEEQDLVFEEIDEDIVTNLFEGYHFQDPDVSVDNTKIINKIIAFRTELLDPDVVEYVATYQDTDSQGRFGLYEKKITFPDYIDTVTIANIANAILEQKALPQDKISIKNYEIKIPFIVPDAFIVDSTGVKMLLVDTDGLEDSMIIVDKEITPITLPLDFGNYAISNKRTNYWKLIADCDTLTGWNIAGIVDTTLTMSEDRVLTGKQAMKFVIAAGSTDEYAEFILDEAIALPQKLRLYIYFDTVAPTLKITYSDDDGNSFDVDFTVASPTDQWIKTEEDSVQLTQVVNLDAWHAAANEDIQVDMLADPNLQLEVRDEVEPGLLKITKVRITILTDVVSTFYVDRLDCLASIYQYRKLQLEEVTYNLSSAGLFADLDFGRKEDSVIDEIKESVKEGNMALDIFSKNLT